MNRPLDIRNESFAIWANGIVHHNDFLTS